MLHTQCEGSLIAAIPISVHPTDLALITL
eukprot:SAG11_NODE_25204_length_362_cov_0.783270_1_plen_28_part_10